MKTNTPSIPYLFHTFRRQPVTFIKGRGSYLWDRQEKKYLDFFSGLAVCGLGHSHPAVTQAVTYQAKTLVHTSNIFYTEPQIKLSEILSQRTFKGRIFFSNSGAEANECALKIARRHGALTPVRGKPRHEIIVFKNAFHGRTFGALAATPQPAYKKNFGPMLTGFPVARFGDIESVKRKITSKTCAIFIEPIQGEGGVNVAHREFFKKLRVLARKHNLLLMFDEVQTGVGRTGQLFAYQYLRVRPDVFTMAKGLANGLPLGATMAPPQIADLLKPGDHASTFSGGPVVCAAATAVLTVLNKKLLARIQKIGTIFEKELQLWKKEFSFIKSVRGMGCMWGIELNHPGAAVVAGCLADGLLVNCAAGKVIRLLPPFCLTDAEIKRGLRILKENIKRV